MRAFVYSLVLLVALCVALSSLAEAGIGDLFNKNKDNKQVVVVDKKQPPSRKAKSGDSDDQDLISQITQHELEGADYKSERAAFKRPRRFRDLPKNLESLRRTRDDDQEEGASGEPEPPAARRRQRPARPTTPAPAADEEEEEEEEEVVAQPKAEAEKKDDWGVKFLKLFKPKDKQAADDKSPLENDDDADEDDQDDDEDDERKQPPPVDGGRREQAAQHVKVRGFDDDQSGAADKPVGKLVRTRVDDAGAENSQALRPKLNYLVPDEAAKRELAQATQSKYFSRRKLKAKLKSAYKATKEGVIKPVVGAIADIPKGLLSCTNGLQACMPINNRGHLLAMLDEVDKDIAYVRREFSQFSLTWSPIMMSGLNVIGASELNKLKWDEKDQLELRGDALMSVTFGYEFMRMMVAWRENMLIGHHTFRSYLEQVIDDLGFAASAETIDKNLAFQLEAVHHYILYRTWLIIERSVAEAKLKLDHLMMVNDDREKNYEIEYFRNIVVLQELYVPTLELFERERLEIVEGVSKAGVMNEETFNQFFDDIDHFYDQYRNQLTSHQFKDIDWEVPSKLSDFLRQLEPELRFNGRIYKKQFLRELKDALDDPKGRRGLFEVSLQSGNEEED